MTVPYRLAAGPNNPTGILWINLAKGSDPKALPYGLHGTSIPGAMTKQESIGGFRLTNWDIARAVRRLIETAGVAVNRPAAEAGLAMLEAGWDFADGVIAFEGTWLGGEAFVSFDRRAVELLAAKGVAARLLG